MNSRWIKSGGAVLAILLLGVAGVWAWSRNGPPNPPEVPKELTVAALKERFEQPDTGPRGFREIAEREDLSEEQRQQVRRNMRQVFQSMLDERTDEYFNAAAGDKAAVLDRHIDEWVERMEDWRRRREEMRREREARGEEPESAEQRRERWRQMRGSRTAEQRKQRSESRSPDAMARRMTYFSAIRQRMAERGIEPPMGRGGFRGGRGRSD